MIDIYKLEKKYSSDFTLKIDELHIDDGERVAVIGQNGSGKSTLFRILAGLIKPDSGSFVINADRGATGYQPQEPYCFAGSVEANIRLGAHGEKLEMRERSNGQKLERNRALTAPAFNRLFREVSDGHKNVDELLRQCRLSELAHKKSSQLSGGERQRMCFARMLAGRYSCLLLDEPLSAADIETAAALEKLLVGYCGENNTTLLMSTHLPSQAFAVSTKVLILHNGCVAEYTDTKKALVSPESEFGRKFINQWRLS